MHIKYRAVVWLELSLSLAVPIRALVVHMNSLA